ncbi:MAG: helix-hairpin-helix domain-containing protein [Pseudomonadota bacterium]
MNRWIWILALLLSGSVLAGEPVDVNRASAEEIARSLDGVGLSKAEAIVAYRKLNGAFKHRDELVKVKGIGLATVERNRDYIQIGVATARQKLADGRKSG